MAALNDPSALFPSADNSTRDFLMETYILMQEIASKIVDVDFYISFPGIILTLFHLTVLTRKSMRTSSVMSIMTATAICDLISMIVAIAIKDIVQNFHIQDCVPPNTLLQIRFYIVSQAIRDAVIRCSTLLSVSMALLRYVVLKRAATRPGVQGVSQFRFGFYVFGVLFTISTFLSSIFLLKLDIVKIKDWRPAEYCSNALTTDSVDNYGTVPSKLFNIYNGIILRVYMFLNGFLSKILPCIMFPVLTALLIVELGKAKKNRKTSSVQDSQKNKTDRTTGLVVFISTTFFIALLPSGIVTSLQAAYTDIGFLYMAFEVNNSCSGLLTVNATFHCFICFAMSSQYRKTVKCFLKISEKRTHRVVSLDQRS